MSAYYDDESTIDSRLDYAPRQNTFRSGNLDTSTFSEAEDDDRDDRDDRNDNRQDDDRKDNRQDEENVNQSAQNNKASLPDEITRALREFINLCGQIKDAKDEIKALCERKSELEGLITQFMVSHDIPAFKTPNGKISVYQAKTVKPLNKDFFKETISAKISDTRMVEELTNLAFTGRPIVSTPKIKITPPKRDD